MNNFQRAAVFLLLMLTGPGVSGQAMKNSDVRKVVFVAGTDSHGKGEHEHNGGSSFLSQKLKEHFRDIETVVCENGWPADQSVFTGAHAIVIYCDGGGDHMLMPHLEKLDTLIKKDVGIVMLHFTLEIPKEQGQKYFVKWIGGYFETDWSVNPVWTASVSQFPDHPITNGLKPFSLKDEWYYHMRFNEGMEGITPVLQTLPPDSTLNREEGTHSNNRYVREAVLVKKQPQILAWAFDRPDGGRGFGFTGGHIHANWKDENFRKLVLNAIAWTSGLTIPENGIITKNPELADLEKLSKQM